MKPPNTYRFLKMSMKVKASAPVVDGIIMYCAESPRGHGGFTSLAVKNGRLEFRYDLGEGIITFIFISLCGFFIALVKLLLMRKQIN